MALLQPGTELPSGLLKAVLRVLLGLAHDEISCEAIQQTSGIPRIIKLLEYVKDDQVRVSTIYLCLVAGGFSITVVTPHSCSGKKLQAASLSCSMRMSSGVSIHLALIDEQPAGSATLALPCLTSSYRVIASQLTCDCVVACLFSTLVRIQYVHDQIEM